jgi:hypothetical protein
MAERVAGINVLQAIVESIEICVEVLEQRNPLGSGERRSKCISEFWFL